MNSAVVACDAEKGRIDTERQRGHGPDRHEHNLAPQVVADLDLLLVLMGCVVDVIVVARLEEKVPDLPAGHAEQPSQQNGGRRIRENQHVGA
jgi:hypothetical protein